MNLVTRNSLVSTARPNKNKVCAEKDEQQLDVFSYVSPEQRVLHDHPLRSLRAMSDDALQQLRPRLNKLYAKTGRPSIALVSSTLPGVAIHSGSSEAGPAGWRCSESGADRCLSRNYSTVLYGLALQSRDGTSRKTLTPVVEFTTANSAANCRQRSESGG